MDSVSRRWPRRIGSLLWGARDFWEFGRLWNHIKQVVSCAPEENRGQEKY